MIAESKTTNSRVDSVSIKAILLRENKFVQNLLSILPIPTSALPEKDGEDDDKPSVKSITYNNTKEKTRAQSLTELQERLKSVQSKKKLKYKDKLLKKGLKNRLKKKTKLEERNFKQKLIRMEKSKSTGIKHDSDANEENAVKTPKPVFNRDGKMVFSKFDFSGLGSQKNDKKVVKDPKKILKNLEKQKEKLAEMEQKGDKDKVKKAKEKHAWNTALAKSEGLKVKDDPILLKKTIKKKEQQRKGSSKKWQTRQDGVNKAQEIRQQKRTENIEQRKKEKKNKKLKQASKRGRIIPGF